MAGLVADEREKIKWEVEAEYTEKLEKLQEEYKRMFLEEIQEIKLKIQQDLTRASVKKVKDKMIQKAMRIILWLLH